MAIMFRLLVASALCLGLIAAQQMRKCSTLMFYFDVLFRCSIYIFADLLL